MVSIVMPNAVGRVLSIHVVGSIEWHTSNRVAHGLSGHQDGSKPILIMQSKLHLTMIAHEWWKWPCLCLQAVLAPKHLLGGKVSSLAVA